jgi:hypothetical protein
MNKWIWIAIIVALAIVAFFVGRANGKKAACGCADAKSDKPVEVAKTGIDQKASAAAGK